MSPVKDDTGGNSFVDNAGIRKVVMGMWFDKLFTHGLTSRLIIVIRQQLDTFSKQLMIGESAGKSGFMTLLKNTDRHIIRI